MINFLMIMEKAVCTLGLITLRDKDTLINYGIDSWFLPSFLLSGKPNFYVSWSASELSVSLARHKTGLSSPIKYFYWPFQGGASFVDPLCYFCLVFVMFSWRVCLLMPCCHFPIGILGQVWCMIVLIPDLCPLSHFYFCYITKFYIHNNLAFQISNRMMYFSTV